MFVEIFFDVSGFEFFDFNGFHASLFSLFECSSLSDLSLEFVDDIFAFADVEPVIPFVVEESDGVGVVFVSEVEFVKVYVVERVDVFYVLVEFVFFLFPSFAVTSLYLAVDGEFFGGGDVFVGVFEVGEFCGFGEVSVVADDLFDDVLTFDSLFEECVSPVSPVVL